MHTPLALEGRKWNAFPHSRARTGGTAERLCLTLINLNTAHLSLIAAGKGIAGTMQIPRSRQRIGVDISVVVTTVLDSLEGTIVDLSEGGAQIRGCTLPARSQCQIGFEGQIVFGTVQWSEPDRIGVRFPYELVDGPLFDLLEMARTRLCLPLVHKHGGRGLAPRAFSPQPTGFGRRTS